jgi:hypothetical protein
MPDPKGNAKVIAAAAGIATVLSFGLVAMRDARASSAAESAIVVRVAQLEQAQNASAAELREIRNQLGATRELMARMCAVTPGCGR